MKVPFALLLREGELLAKELLLRAREDELLAKELLLRTIEDELLTKELLLPAGEDEPPVTELLLLLLGEDGLLVTELLPPSGASEKSGKSEQLNVSAKASPRGAANASFEMFLIGYLYFPYKAQFCQCRSWLYGI